MNNKDCEDIKNKIGNFRILESFSAERSIDNHSVYEIEIKLSNTSSDFITLNFTRCFSVVLGNLLKSLSVELDVMNVALDQIEGARYRINDSEGSGLDFLCDDIAVK